MTRRRPLAALCTTAVMAMFAACSAVSGFDGDPEPTEVSMVLDDDRQRVIDATTQVFAALSDVGFEPFGASMLWAGCDRDKPTYQAKTSGRLDHAGGRSSTLEDAELVRDLLVQLGWTARNGSSWTDGIWADTAWWQVSADRGELAINAYLYGDHPFVAVRVLGPCVEVGESNKDAYTVDFEAVDLNELVGAPPRPVDTTTPAPPTTS